MTVSRILELTLNVEDRPLRRAPAFAVVLARKATAEHDPARRLQYACRRARCRWLES